MADKLSKWMDLDYEKYTKKANDKSKSEEEQRGERRGFFYRLLYGDYVSNDRRREVVYTDYQPKGSFEHIFWKIVEASNGGK